MRSGEPVDRRQHERARGGLERRDPDRAAHVAGRLGQLGLDLLEPGQKLTGAGRERPPRVCQLEPPPRPAKQRHAALALELGELLGHGGRRERERVGGARDRPLGDELAQDGEPAWIEHTMQYR